MLPSLSLGLTPASVRTAASFTCPYQLRGPRVVMVQAAEDRRDRDLTDTLDGTSAGSIFCQREMWPGAVVIASVGAKDLAEVPFAED